jgi:hypothetical protein
MGGSVLDLKTIDRSQVTLTGGKGAHLGELSRIDGGGRVHPSTLRLWLIEAGLWEVQRLRPHLRTRGGLRPIPMEWIGH